KSEDVNDGETNHARHLIAVSIQFVKGLELLGLQVGTDAIDHFVEIFVRDFVTLHGVVKRRPQRILAILARERESQIAAPSLNPFAGSAFAFADIVAIAHERINGTHALALLTR